ncbi:hypothetical protein G9A89_007139 [Geosiphon pyriformis]|nr:hypothetical protein G9A89_007139 [Geosiphon pyriformis]
MEEIIQTPTSLLFDIQIDPPEVKRKTQFEDSSKNVSFNPCLLQIGLTEKSRDTVSYNPCLMAISPNGQLLATLDGENHTLSYWEIDENRKLKKINSFIVRQDIGTFTGNLRWSLAVSDIDDSRRFFTVLSWYSLNEEQSPVNIISNDLNDSFNNQELVEKYKHFGEIYPESTSFFRSDDTKTYSFPFAGVVKFIEQSEIVLLKIDGFLFFNLERRRQSDRTESENLPKPRSILKSLYTRMVPPSVDIRESAKHEYPSAMESRLHRTSGQDAYKILQNCIHQDYLFSVDGNNNIELYSLKTGDMELLLHTKKDLNNLPDKLPTFSIAKNRKFVAASLGNNTVTIYLMENSLEVATHSCKFDDGLEFSIIFVGFFDNDHKLAIFLQQQLNDKQRDIHNLGQKLCIWDLSEKGGIETRYFNYQEAIDGLEIISIEEKVDFFLNNIFRTRFPRRLTTIDSAGESNHLDENTKFQLQDYEPWNNSHDVINSSVFLDKDRTRQLVVGRHTIQIRRVSHLHKYPGKLEYIWVVSKEISTEIGPNIISCIIPEEASPSSIRLHLGYEKESPYFILLNRGAVTVPLPPSAVTVIDCVIALRILKLKRNLNLAPPKRQKLEKLISDTVEIIQDFVNSAWENPNSYRLLDVHYQLTAKMIEADCNDLVKKILNYKDSEKKNRYLHIPQFFDRVIFLPIYWLFEKSVTLQKNVLLVALENNNFAAIKYLLDYYAENAFDNIGWMNTITPVLPSIQRAFPDLVTRLFSQNVFGIKPIHLDKSHLGVIQLEPPSGKEIKAFTIDTNIFRRRNTFQKLETHRLLEKGSINFSMVPLPGFILKPKMSGFSFGVFQLLADIFHMDPFGLRNSPFYELILHDHKGEIFENPAMDAVIDFQWRRRTTWLFFLKSALYWIYLISFMFWSILFLKYTVHQYDNERLISGIARFNLNISLFMLLLELRRLFRLRHRYFQTIYGWFDLTSCGLPFAISIHVISLGKIECSKSACTNEVILFSFTCFILSIQLFLRIRFIPKIGEYIFIIINIVGKVFWFLVSQVFIAAAFAFSMQPSGTTFNTTPDSQYNFTLAQKIDTKDYIDNYYYKLWKSIEAVFFWTNGRWDQLEQWNFWPVDVLTVLASIFLVIIMQNMLIALMSSVFESARRRSRRGLLQTRTRMIMEAEEIEEVLIFFVRAFKRLLFFFGWHNLTPNKRDIDLRQIYYAANKKTISKWFESNNNPSVKKIIEVNNRIEEFQAATNIGIRNVYASLDEVRNYSSEKLEDLDKRIENMEKNILEILKSVKGEISNG